MNYSNYILSFVSRQTYTPTDADTLFSKLGFSEQERALYKKTLDSLCARGELHITKNGKITLPAESVSEPTGTFSATAKGFGFIRPDGSDDPADDIFVPASGTCGAINGDTVAYSTTVGSDGRTEGRVTEVREHSVTHIIGNLVPVEVRGRTRYAVQPDKAIYSFLIYTDNSEAAGKHPDGIKVEAEITAYPDARRDALGHITKVFGNGESTGANFDAILHSYGIRTAFPREVSERARSLEREKISTAGRLDLRDALIFTVDGADSKDLDDAISVVKTSDGYELGVHIADVSHYVREGDVIDREAFSRGTSVYFSDRVVPMLPEELSNGICSLNCGEDRYAMSAFVTLSRSGAILDIQIERTVIRSAVRGVYSELNDVLARGRRSEFYGKYEPVYSCLRDIVELYRILEKKGRARGAVELETEEAKIILKNGEPVDIVKRTRGLSERIIEQFMLCANEAVATYLYRRKLPCVYRVHDEPTEEKLKNLRAYAYGAGLDISRLRGGSVTGADVQSVLDEAKAKGIDNVVSAAVLRTMSKAVYSAENRPHFGLGIEKYCHFTSPIRRYPDLCCHRILGMMMDGELRTDESVAHMKAFTFEAAAHSSENERRAISAEREADDLYKCIYMQSRVGARYEGKVSGMSSSGLFIELENTCDGFVPINTLHGYFTYNERSMTFSSTRKIYRLGDRVWVKVAKCDIPSRRIYMEAQT